LREYVRDGKFREDLYYRLSVFPIQWKPLRERPDDIVPLARRLLLQHCRKMKIHPVALDASAEKAMLDYHWPGNVRELDNAIQRALILQQGGIIHADELCLDNTGHGWMLIAESGIERSGGSVAASLDAHDTRQHRRPCEAEIETLFKKADFEKAGFEKAGFETVESEKAGLAEIFDRSDIAPGSLGGDLKKREFQIIVDTIKNCGKRKLAAEKLGISPRTLRYKLAQMRDYGIDIEAELLV
jgi:two-component system response regulator FlrC